eukprot:scaffold5715_cov206-Pinguiococcus_pyrenoidosus.AAC.1
MGKGTVNQLKRTRCASTESSDLPLSRQAVLPPVESFVKASGTTAKRARSSSRSRLENMYLTRSSASWTFWRYAAGARVNLAISQDNSEPSVSHEGER